MQFQQTKNKTQHRIDHKNSSIIPACNLGGSIKHFSHLIKSMCTCYFCDLNRKEKVSLLKMEVTVYTEASWNVKVKIQCLFSGASCARKAPDNTFFPLLVLRPHLCNILWGFQRYLYIFNCFLLTSVHSCRKAPAPHEYMKIPEASCFLYDRTGKTVGIS